MSDDQRLLEYLKRVTVDLRKARRRLHEVEEREREPIAIVGMACRYPGGVSSPEELWGLVSRGGDAISAFPADRGWDLRRLPDAGVDDAGKGHVHEGGFLYEAGEFDADFFGISPREALATDPQQRLLLEVCWEAMEDSRLDPASLQGSQTGVFAGISSQDYHHFSQGMPSGLEGYGMTGGATSVVSGRVAYTFGFEGPAVTVDTACSSSLVSIHLACQSLRAQECSLALAGGVTVLCSPSVFVEFVHQDGLAHDGRCKPFSDHADGTGFSEGVGVVMLERLSDARRNGHLVLAVVRGSAVNQDGASNGLTAPNGPSQQRVIRQALASAGLSASEVDVVEAHGTGTKLGDPIEAQALISTYGQDRAEGRPLWLGSIKSNIGHTQAAAGVAGLIKMVMALRHGTLPRTLHAEQPSSQINWSEGAVSLLAQEQTWAAAGRPRRAAVSSFGISGTNAHMIVEEAPTSVAKAEQEPTEDPLGEEVVQESRMGLPEGEVVQEPTVGPLGGALCAWVLSARDRDGLRGQADRLDGHLSERADLPVREVGRALARRPTLEHRAVLLGGADEDLRSRLRSVGRENDTVDLLEGIVREAGRTVFVFPGQGGQWLGMAVGLMESSSVFAERIGLCESALAPFVDWCLGDVLRGVVGAPGFDRVDVVQPVLFAVMVGLAELWDECGVRPDVVVGHSQGEIAAACVAGALSLEDAARVVAVRSKALAVLSGRGGMVSVGVGLEELDVLCGSLDGCVSVAAVNGPRATVVSGELTVLEGLLAVCGERGVRARRIPVDYAAHSPQVEEIREELLVGCESISPCSGGVPFYSTVVGGLVDTATLDAGYWYRNLRESVQFEQVIRVLAQEGCGAFVEVSPHPVLTVGTQDTIDDVSATSARENPPGALTRRRSAAVLGSLRRQEGGPERFARSLAEAWVHGVQVDWQRVFDGPPAELPSLPTYAFQRRRYWLEPREGADASSIGQTSAGHPLLGAEVSLAGEGGWLFTGRLSLQSDTWLADHAIAGTVLLPGTAFLELALHAGMQAGCDRVVELTIESPLVFDESAAVQLQLSLGAPGADGLRPLRIDARAESAEEADSDSQNAWTRHASGLIAATETEPGFGVDDPTAERVSYLSGEWPPPGAMPLQIDDFYEVMADRGLEYGPAFQGLRATWRRGDDLFAEVSLPDEYQNHASTFGLHPALLDAALHAAAAHAFTVSRTDTAEGPLLPFSWRDVRLHGIGPRALRVLLSQGPAGAISLIAADENGTLVASVGSLSLRPVSAERLRRTHGRAHESLLGVTWIPAPRALERDSESWVALGKDRLSLRALLGEHGASVDCHADIASLARAVEEGTSVPEVVLWECASPPGGDGLASDVRERAHEVLDLIQAWLSHDRLATSRLVVLTKGAVSTQAGEPVPGLVDSATWGLVRSAQLENPGRFLLLDIEVGEPSHELLVSAVNSALAHEEQGVAIRDGVVYAPRLARAGSAALSVPEGASEWRVEAVRAGTLDGLQIVRCPECSGQLEPNEVRVAIRAAGLNFKDVIGALGLVPGDRDIVGREGAGVVLEVGSGVTSVSVGDRVMGLIPGCFGPRAVADQRLLIKIPDEWSFVEAASVPAVFLTAYYGLVDLAHLRAGERLLVHAAAGGVGMAAVQIARHLGAEVFATASPAKWDALRAIGCEQPRVANSRDLDFREQFLDLTGGEGVDVVLNSLAGEFVDASLDLLPAGGRFIEMGKADVRDAQELAGERSGVLYNAFDLTEVSPERIQEMMLELRHMFEQGALQRLPVRTWDVRHAPEAFRFMSQGRHVGKIVLTLPVSSYSGATVLITGGTGQIGGLLARHLVTTHGVGNLILTSRRGLEAPGARQLQAELVELGACVQVVECDVSDRAQLEELINAVPAEHPLTGVVHAAGVLEDTTIESLSFEQLDRVFAPKLDGAVHLHELTQHLDLPMFVLFSSVAGTFGSPGQANYAAANSFLDALAAHRRALGMAGISIAWGWWGEGGDMAAHMSELDVARMKRSGIQALSSKEGLDLYDLAVEAPDALVVPVRLDLAVLRTQARAGSLTPLMGELVGSGRAGKAAVGDGSLVRRLAGLEDRDRRAAVLELVCAQAAVVLGHSSADALNPDRAFKELGFDSLLGVELRNRLTRVTGLRLSATLVFDYPTPAELAGHILNELTGIQTEAPRARSAVAVDEPIAIVGMACRYPGGANSPQALWELVLGGEDAISSFPTDRGWNLEALQSRDSGGLGSGWDLRGGFMFDAGEFDAEFFGIGPREALAMDPQQRLLMEVCWEAIERAGIDPFSLRGAQAGVFAGVAASGYGGIMSSSSSAVEGYRLTGSVTSAVTGRVAYTLGLEGPAVSVDTACSSSLVALHLACQALRQGECTMALSGGVMVLAAPDLFIEFNRQGGLAHDGRCKAFSAEADGTGLSEGAGVVLLERLSDARRLGHPVAAVIKGSAVDQDGASNGLSAPNGLSQQRVIAQTLMNAGLKAHEVDAVEAHGTGTRLGDPIEAQALIATYGRDRDPGRPLLLGSVKSNIGHAATAAGIAGVIKMAMALEHGVLPATLHAQEPSHEIDWSTGAVELLSEVTPWPANGKPRRAGVSSFGISGTNAHLILEEAPTVRDALESDEPIVGADDDAEEVKAAGESFRSAPLSWAISARGEAGLQAQAQQLLDYLEQRPELDTADIGFSLAARPVFEHRAVVLGDGRDRLLRNLRALSQGEAPLGVARAVARGGKKVAFLFSGQGSQRVGMGDELRCWPTFAGVFGELCSLFDGLLARPLSDVLLASGKASEAESLDQTSYAQAGLFALEVALFRQLESWGLRPDYLLGHSIGELAAAHVAGVFSLEDACRLVAARGQLMAELPAGGEMLAIQASPQEALDELVDLEDRVSLAAVNGPSSVVVSGERDAVAELAGRWERLGRKTRRLRVSHAFHSPLMDAMLQEFHGVAEQLSFNHPAIPIVSNITGEAVDAERICSADYWVDHVRQTVRFADGVRWLDGQGVGTFVELGPDGVLGAMCEDCLEDARSAAGEGIEEEPRPLVVSLLRRGQPEAETVLGAIAQAWAHGSAVDWRRVLDGTGARRVELPTYAFQRARYWLDAPPLGAGDLRSVGLAGADHPLLGVSVALADGEGWLFTGRLGLQSSSWVADHVVLGVVLVPGTTFVEIALRAGELADCEVLRELVIEAPLVLGEQDVQLQVVLGEQGESGERPLSIHSRLAGPSGEGVSDRHGWTRHASGVMCPSEAALNGQNGWLEEQTAAFAADEWPPADAEPVSVDELYDRLATLGLDYGPAFIGVRAAWRRGREVFAELALEEEHGAQADKFGVHPALLDVTLQAALVPMFAADGQALDTPSIPFAWSGVRLHGSGARTLRAHSSISQSGEISLFAVDEGGRPAVSIDALALRPVSREQLEGASGSHTESLFYVDWSAVVQAGGGGGNTRMAILTPWGSGDGRGERGLYVDSPPDECEVYSGLDELCEALDGDAPAPDVMLVDGASWGPLVSSARVSGARVGGAGVDGALKEGGSDASKGGLVEVAHGVSTWMLDFLQRALTEERLSECRFVVLTAGAVAVGSDDLVLGLGQSAVWGLVRSAQSEFPGRLVLVDLDGRELSAHLMGIVLAGEEPQLAVRGEEVLRPRLARFAAPAEAVGSMEASVRAVERVEGDASVGVEGDASVRAEGDVSMRVGDAPVRVEGDASSRAGDDVFEPGNGLGEVSGTVLITGGTGGLGGHVARRLVLRHRVRSILLVSRQGISAPGAKDLEADLKELGARVRIAACDVSDRAQLRGLIESIPAECPLQMVVHAAGVLDDGVMTSLTAERVERVLEPKLDAAWHLHELTEHMDLRAFVLFSSAAGVLGAAGQGAYAAGNAFLDALASYRRARGLTATSLAWGWWAQQGMAARLGEGERSRLARSGMLAMPVEEGLDLLDVGWATQEASLAPMRLDVAALRAQARAGWVTPLLRGIVRVPVRQASAAAEGSLAQRLAGMSATDGRRVVLELVRREVATVLGHGSPEAIEVRRPFNELGLDSLGGVELRNQLARVTGLRLPATLVFDYPTPVELVGHIVNELAGAPVNVVPARSAVLASEDSIAIVGMSCRYPGEVCSPEDLWELVVSGRDAISSFPTDRGWDLESLRSPDPDRPEANWALQGGFLGDAADFDAEFFGIGPREALAMDPQQRLLLEVCWEAIERAGIDPFSLRGTTTGVFAGVTGSRYGGDMLFSSSSVAGYRFMGGAPSVATGRVAYSLGLEGPAVSVDTACSSSLVALHLACQALRQGECSMALAGGAVVMAGPELFVEFSRQRGLARDGRCKSFSAEADGTGWSEGAGIVVVERLSDALRLGHRVAAVVRGSAINQDGASNGLSAPNGPSQQRVIRQALANARLQAHQVDAVEAHGTGTRLGDPIEAQALIATYGQDRDAARPLRLGSIKSNIGHSAMAAGVAGVIKMAMALEREVLPATLHVEEPSTEIDWSAGAVELLSEAMPWAANGGPRRAGVSSFGISGTNAHVILEEAPTVPDGHEPELVERPVGDAVARGAQTEGSAGIGQVVLDGRIPWVLSGRSEQALRSQARELSGRLRELSEVSLDDIGRSLAARPVFERRAVLLGTEREDLLQHLDAIAQARPAPAAVTGAAGPAAGEVVFLFPGQGSQWVGMGAELLEHSPVFAERIVACAEALAPHVDWSLEDLLKDAEDAPSLDRVDVVQPALFAVMVSLAGLWRACGVHPNVVVGHSQGEVAAACVAGALSLQDAARVVTARSKALLELAGHGGMVSIAASTGTVENLIGRCGTAVSIAAVNGPSSVVVSGANQALEELLKCCGQDQLRAKRIAVDYAAHSPQVEAIGEELRAACVGISPRPGEIPFYSSVVGDRLDGSQLDAEYWYRNLRETVRFEQVTRALLSAGLRTFIEVSPAPALAAGTLETAELHFDGERDGHGSSQEYYASAADVRVHGSLRRGQGGSRRFLTSLSEAWTAGVEVDWRALLGNGRTVPLPTYPFQRERYWLDPTEVGGHAPRAESPTSDWRYRIAWKHIEQSQAALSGDWMVLVPASHSEDRWVDSVLEALRAHGAQVTRAEVDAEAMSDRGMLAECMRDALAEREKPDLSSQRADLGADEEHVSAPRERSSAAEAKLDGVLSLLSLVEAHDERCDAVPSGLAGTLTAVQALEDMAVEAPLWMATRGAVSVEDSDRLQNPTQGMVWGLGRVIGLELSRRRGGLLDLPATLDAGVRGSLCSALGGAGSEDQLAVRSDGLYARRLVPAPVGSAASTSPWKPRGTVLITGGLGGLGAHVARWLAGAGAEHLILASRRGADAEGATELEDELERLGAHVSVVACDVSDRSQLSELLESLPADHPLDAIVHAAGVQDGEALATTSIDSLQEGLAAKAQAALHLHELTQEMDLSAFVMFSSMAATMGSANQGAYAAANAFLDALAEYRKGRGLVATSVAWGMWAGAGMGEDSTAVEELRRRGILSIEPERAIGALQQALDDGDTCLTVSRVDWSRYAPNYVFAGPRPLIEDLPAVRDALAAAQAGLDRQPAGDALASRLSGLSKRERERVVLELVRGEAAGVLGHAELDPIDPQRAFKELGFDSLTAVEMRRRLQVATGLRLLATVVFDYPTPILLAGHLLREATGASEQAPAARPSAARTQEPIAIVAMSCRYPGGVRSPEDLWEIVHSGVDAVGEFPTDRGWDLESLYDPDPDRHGTSYAREGGFVHDIGEFDAGFFGISPREALAMDPQQRILLEVCWETLERAGVDPLSLRGTDTGIFVGINPTRYGLDLPGELEGYQVTAGAGSAISGRVSYTFGLEGPAVSVDTACSSSLVALHLACGALRGEECELALAGGVAVMSTPDGFVAFSRQRGLALDGRCKSFADAADGTGWSEGAGVLLLERLSDAQRLGHPILALVRGSAINQDGASNGLTAPNGLAQQRVIHQALANAGLSVDQVQAVEGHGTGTSLGDPIEAQALLATYGRRRDADSPLWLGSIKSNIGHPQAAGGAAGVIKMVMALRHATLPKTLHCDEPSRQVDWRSGAVELLREGRAWESDDEPRRAGVSSFGASGTNAHVIVEQAPEQAPDASASASDGDEEQAVSPLTDVDVVPWVVSGKGEAALRDQARKLLAHLERDPDVAAADVGLSLAAGRAALDRRAVIVGSDREGLLSGLRSLTQAQPDPGVTEGVAHGVDVAMAFLFTGQGAQRVGMGRELYGRFSVFRESLEEACGYLDELLKCSLREVMFGDDSNSSAGDGEPTDGQSRLDDTMFAQTGLFALELSLFRLLEDLGVRPDYLLGHSIGELTAAHVAGVLTLNDACALVAARGRLMEALPEGGAMVSIQASEDEALESLIEFGGRASLAAVNGPGAIVLSGDEEAILELTELWGSRGRKTKRLRVSHAFHSHRMQDMLAQYAEVAKSLTFTSPHIPIVSNLTGEQMLVEQACDPAYWVRQVREPVRFYDGVSWLVGQGASCLLELGPDGVLSAMSLECLPGITSLEGPEGESAEGESAHDRVTATSVLRGARPEVSALLSALAETWVHGVAVDWVRVLDGQDAQRLRLPTYAFQRQRYWLAGGRSRSDGLASTAPGIDHPILESSVALADGRGWLFTGELSLDSQPWVADHVVMGVALVPGTTFVDLALTVAEEVGCDFLAELVMESPLVLTGREHVQLQISVAGLDEAGRRELEIYSRVLEPSRNGSSGPEEWTRHASGLLAQSINGGSQDGGALDASIEGSWPPDGAEPLAVEDVYEFAARAGVDYGPAFLTVGALWRRADQLFAEARLPEHELARAGRFRIHPALLDAALHSSAVYSYGSEQMQIPFEWKDVSVRRAAATALRVSISQTPSGGISLTVMDDLGAPLASVGSLVVRAVTAAQLGSAADRGQSSLSRVDWVALAIDRAPSRFKGVLVGEQGERLGALLRSADESHEVYEDIRSLGDALDGGAAVPETVVVACMTDWREEGAGNLTNGHISDNGLGGAHDGDMPERMRGATHLALDLIQAWLADTRLSQSRLAFVTRNAVAVTPDESVDGLAQAGIWGLVRAAAAESPRRLLLVDLDGEQSSWQILPQALRAASMLDEPQLAIRKGDAFAPRLAPVERNQSQDAAVHDLAVTPGSFDPNGTVLITGGTGALGILVARHLVTRHGVRHLLLASRGGRDAQGALELAGELEELGAEVNIEACDVSERDRLREMLASVADEHPLRAVVHLAGVLDDGMVGSLTFEQVDRVLAPKVSGAWHLHCLTEHLDLSAFVLFSSASGVLGGKGQANYAAANAFLDALAAHRRAHGLTSLSLAWGPWEATDGMAGGLGETDRMRMARAGVAAISDAEALDLFDVAQERDESLLVPVRLDLPLLSARAATEASPSMLRGVARLATRHMKGVESGALAKRLVGAPRHEHARVLLDAVCTHTAIVLGHSASDAVEAKQPFKDLGFDSLAAVELRNRLNRELGVSLPATLIFEYPTPKALADYLLENIAPDGASSALALDVELDRLERLLATAVSDESSRSKVSGRLQAILNGLSESSSGEGSTVAEKMHSATAEEVLDFIDRELRSR